MLFYLEDIHLLVPFLQDLPDSPQNLLAEISIPIPYVFHGRTGVIQEDITFDVSAFDFKIACFYLCAHSELWSNPKHLNLCLENYHHFGLTDVNNTTYDPGLRPL